MTKPNILFIMCDQMRYDALGSSGNAHVQTPHLDQLAAEGVRFTNAFTPNPICVPARAALTTGCYPHKCIGNKNNGGTIQPGYPLLGEELTRRGYDCSAIGKLHYLPYKGPGETRTTHGIAHTELAESGRILANYDPLHAGKGLEDFHDYLASVGWKGYTRANGMGNNDVFPAASLIPQEHYVDTWIADRSIDIMENHAKSGSGRPFFLWASFPKPHSAFDPPRPYDAMYDPRAMPEPTGSPDLLGERGLGDFESLRRRFMWDKLSPEAMRTIKAYYYGLITHQDVQVGRLLACLDKHGLSESTLVVYTSDHGEMLGDFGLFFKSNCYNASVRIPLIMKLPGQIADGSVCDELVGLQDLLPTMLGYTGERLMSDVDGVDLAPWLTTFACSLNEENCPPVRPYYVSQCLNSPRQQYMVANQHWKYIVHERGGVEELYDQQQDRAELNNLACSTDATIHQQLADMRQYLKQWCAEHHDDQMLVNGELVVSEPLSEEERLPRIENPFGRRFY